MANNPSPTQGSKGSRIRTSPAAESQPAEQPRSFVENVIANRRMKFFCVTKKEMKDISKHNEESSSDFALSTAFAGTAIGILSNFANTSLTNMSTLGDAFLYVGVPVLIVLAVVYWRRSQDKKEDKNSIISTIEEECSESQD